MRVLVSGGTGFVGRWLERELAAAGHHVDALGRGDLDVTDWPAVARRVARGGYDAIAHLAAVSDPSAARRASSAAFETAVRGTANVLEAARQARADTAILVAGSSHVYAPAIHTLTESARLGPITPYGLAKLAQESVALAYAGRLGGRVVVTRSFNHIGPGQSSAFVVPALARRVLSFRDRLSSDIPVGRLDVRRDFLDVRDVARAYRLLLEQLVSGRLQAGGLVVNVSSGTAPAIRTLLESLCRHAGVKPVIREDPDLVRPEEPPLIRGDSSTLTALTSWRPAYSLSRTLADVWAHEQQGWQASSPDGPGPSGARGR